MAQDEDSVNRQLLGDRETILSWMPATLSGTADMSKYSVTR